MPYCKQCGCYVDEDVTECPSCGAKTGKGAFADAFKSFVNTKDHTEEFSAEEIESSKTVSALAYFAITFWLPLAVEPQTSYGRFHANQALLLLIAAAVLSVLSSVFARVFLLGAVLRAVCSLAVLFGFLFGLINTLNGKARELPLIGHFRLLK